MKCFYAVLTAGFLVFGGGCNKNAAMVTPPAETNHMENAEVPTITTPQAPATRQNNSAPAPAPAGGQPKKVPMVP